MYKNNLHWKCTIYVFAYACLYHVLCELLLGGPGASTSISFFGIFFIRGRSHRKKLRIFVGANDLRRLLSLIRYKNELDNIMRPTDDWNSLTKTYIQSTSMENRKFRIWKCWNLKIENSTYVLLTEELHMLWIERSIIVSSKFGHYF